MKPCEERARREINHYAAVYGQDAPVEIRGPKIETFDTDAEYEDDED